MYEKKEIVQFEIHAVLTITDLEGCVVVSLSITENLQPN